MFNRFTKQDATYQKTPTQNARRKPHVTHNENGISMLYKNNINDLVYYLRRRFGEGPPAPEDIAQQAFEKLILRDDLHDVQNLRGYLWRTAKNLMLNGYRDDSLRGNKYEVLSQLSLLDESNSIGPERVVLAKEQLKIINDTLRSMPDKRRIAYVLNRIKGVSFSDIARQFGITHAAVIKQVAKAIAEIDAALERQAGDDLK